MADKFKEEVRETRMRRDSYVFSVEEAKEVILRAARSNGLGDTVVIRIPPLVTGIREFLTEEGFVHNDKGVEGIIVYFMKEKGDF